MRIILIAGIFLLNLGVLYAQDEESYDDYGDGGVFKIKDSKNYTLEVELTTGKTVNTKSNIMIDYCNRIMFIYDTLGNPIYPQNTYSMTRTMNNGTLIKGYPTDSLWLFNIVSGKISLYSARPETKLKHAEFWTIDGSDLKEYNEDSLKTLLSSNTSAFKQFKKYKTHRTLGDIFIITGFASLLTNLYAPIFDDINIGGVDVPVLGTLGGVFIGGSIILKGSSKKHLKRSIEAYNVE